MNVFEAISKRRSIRKYQDRDVEEDKLLRILEAARLAPSARNRQEWRFIVVKDKKVKEELVREASPHQPFMLQAPIIIVAYVLEKDYIMRCGVPAHYIDVAIALTHIHLQAVEEGLGTCWIGSFYQDKVKKVLNLPEEAEVIQLMTLGYPAEDPSPRPRLSLEEIVKFV
ncbi:nitroreductase family protein [Dictyoglomus thermophilum]|uniref:NADH dehydrogenase (H(2)o(2) forming nadh oxidase) n=2 Tax=Dictyoglomus thermophilum TaxID=14 RepID=B5YDL6_DICT6|nr:nitroreductase family protein [Dictyoglomus thermophilum]ACI19488.1 NADH dehydrogenase (h(2)o(2) forming nadh oxidase) [Dictyoglomus thermophilum H-6-12]MCX7721248.1 nitroreductase family protein [Dictyoglomus thermophilum]TYT22848.1 nitroreductase [Dictyoglomus thermophilum]